MSENKQIYNSDTITKLLKDCIDLKPSDMIVSDLKWKHLVRGILREKNCLLIGPSGTGKTKIIKSIAKALKRESLFYKFNMGSSQDARSTLMGNMSFDKSVGTIFNKSDFIKAITTENSIIMLDELSRASHDSWNILMTVLDEEERYLRIDENNSEFIKVASGVCFLAATNIGNEFTSTKTLDKALLNRFPIKVEMEYLSQKVEFDYMLSRYPDLNLDSKKKDIVNALCDVASQTREHVIQMTSITNCITTRQVKDMTEMVIDGFSLEEIAEVSIYPEFSADGAESSERTFMKQLVQKHIVTKLKNPITKI